MLVLIIATFIIGYAMIALEHSIKINKAAIALITGVLCWTFYIINVPDKEAVTAQLTHHLGDLSGILFFLLGAMTVVELIDAHDGFDIITARIKVNKKLNLLWIIAFISFVLSAVLDNLTATIVMVSFLRKLIKEDKERLFFAGVVVISANAGGVWTPIGDVTTTMLWIGGQITTLPTITNLILPCLACLIAPLIFLSFRSKGTVQRPAPNAKISAGNIPEKHQITVLILGLTLLIMVPVFKAVTHLPPYMGMLIGLGILWIITEIMNSEKDEEDKHVLSVVYALRKIDAPSILFFLGILLSIAAFQATGILSQLAHTMTGHIRNEKVIVISIGLLSSVIDNVPLVAAVQGMYSLQQYPTDHSFWQFLAYCAGTGGSVLIIGSAAGVAAMGMEKINFFWYLRKISLLALIGYFAGAFVFILMENL